MKINAILTSLAMVGFAGPVLAEGDLSRANVIDVAIELGTTDDGDMYMKPDHFEFETGQAYALVVTNVDPIKHEISLSEMGEKVFTRKVEISDKDGELVAEIKGSIREVEVGPGWTIEWFIVPVQTMEEGEITCELEGHYEAGMHASVVIH